MGCDPSRQTKGRFGVVFSVVTANVNGIRAAARRDNLQWLADSNADVICLQEVRAPDAIFVKTLADFGFGHWDVVHAPAAAAGRSGVAILARSTLSSTRIGVGPKEFADSGRWVEATVESSLGEVTIVSAYVHTGEAGTGRQVEKYRFLDAMTKRLRQLRTSAKKAGGHVIVCGDLNIAHTERDIKNWRGNRGKAGFLEEERAYLSGWFAKDWVDLGRQHAGEVDGPYTWWSWRGQAFDNDTGWRLDYHLATPELAKYLATIDIGRADSYAQRWSDHAAVAARFTTPPPQTSTSFRKLP